MLVGPFTLKNVSLTREGLVTSLGRECPGSWATVQCYSPQRQQQQQAGHTDCPRDTALLTKPQKDARQRGLQPQPVPLLLASPSSGSASFRIRTHRSEKPPSVFCLLWAKGHVIDYLNMGLCIPGSWRAACSSAPCTDPHANHGSPGRGGS